jgi:hypothetical protein
MSPVVILPVYGRQPENPPIYFKPAWRQQAGDMAEMGGIEYHAKHRAASLIS